MNNITQETLTEWVTLRRQYIKGWHLSESDWRELVRLNHLIMEDTHEIHNANMLRKDK